MPSPLCSQVTVKFSRSFVYPSDNSPASICNSQIAKVITKLDREHLYPLLFEESLTPDLSEAEPALPKIYDAAWSPESLVSCDKCLLATLTTTGAIDILIKISNNWLITCDLSSCRLKQINAESWDYEVSTDSQTNYEAVTAQVRKVVATAITWSEACQFEDSVCSYLVVGYRSGDLVVWRVSRIDELKQNVSPTVAFQKTLEDCSRITKLSWVNLSDNRHLVIVGHFDGRVNAIVLRGSGEVFVQESFVRLHDYEDVPVSSLTLMQLENETVKLLVTKGHFLSLFYLTYLNMNCNVLDTKHHQLAGFNITGCLKINDDRALVTTQDGAIYEILIGEELSSTKVKLDLSDTRIQFLGLARSPNGVMIGTVTSPNGLYDHLAVKEPSTLVLYEINDEIYDPLKILNENPSKSLARYWDCLEMIRLKIARGSDPKQVMTLTSKNMNLLSIYEMRILMWTSVFSEMCGKKKTFQRIDNMVGELSDAEPLIILHSVCEYLAKLLEISDLTREQKVCVYLLRIYIEVFLAGDEDGNEKSPTLQRARELFDTVNNKLNCTESETCNLCGEQVKDFSWKVTNCPKGHKLPRCAVSFMQVTCVNYRTCPICGQMFHPCLEDVITEPRCLFCDVPVLYDPRINGPKGLAAKRINLSKPLQYRLLNPEMENSNKDSAKLVDPQERVEETTVVLLNNDQPGENIIETWQEF